MEAVLFDKRMSTVSMDDSIEDVVILEEMGHLNTGNVETSRSLSIGFLDGMGLVLGLQIGSGIFTTPGVVYGHCKSSISSLIVWFIAGLLTWSGAASYSELGTRFPRNGGTQTYLRELFGKFIAFLYAWSTITILKPGSQAIVATVFAEYFARLVGMQSHIFGKLIASLTVVMITCLHMLSPAAGAGATYFFMVTKVLMLGFIFVLAIIYVARAQKIGALMQENSTHWKELPLALYGALWSYDGWDNLNFVSAEMKDANRDLPRVLNTAMPLLTVLYIVANISYFLVLSRSDLLGEATNAGVSSELAWKVAGKWGSLISEVGISLSCIGSINAQTFTSAHLVVSAAKEDRLIPSIFGWSSPRFGTPIAALSLQAFLAVLYCWVSEFRSLVTFYGAVGYAFYMLTTFGLARYKIGHLKGSDNFFVVPLILPIIFSVAAAFLIVVTVVEKPLAMLAAFGFIAAGAPFYYIFV